MKTQVDYSKSVPTKTQLKIKIDAVRPLRERALFSMLYLTGARVSELVGLDGILVGDMTKEKAGDRDIYVIKVTTKKHRRHPIRSIPVPYDNYKFFIDQIVSYISTVGLKDTDKMFGFTPRHTRRLVNNLLGREWFPHYFRHIRISHLSEAGFTAEELRTFGGWTDYRQIGNYSHLNWMALIGKL